MRHALFTAITLTLTASHLSEAQSFEADGVSFKGGRYAVTIETGAPGALIDIVSLPDGLTVVRRGDTLEVSGRYDWTVCSDASAPNLGEVRLRAPDGVRLAATDAVTVLARGRLGASSISGCSRLDAEALSRSIEAAGAGRIEAERVRGDLAVSVAGAGAVTIDTVDLARLSADVLGGGQASIGAGQVDVLVLETAGRARVSLAAKIGDATVLQGSRSPVRLAQVSRLGGVRQGCAPAPVFHGAGRQEADLPDLSSPQSCRW